MKKTIVSFVVLSLMFPAYLSAQVSKPTNEIYKLIDNYSLARENKDTMLLKTILTSDVDQLVSTGEWRNGIGASVQGMLRSSATSPGTRTLIVEKIRFLDSNNAIADARYDIKNPDGTTRNMWSTFILVADQERWKITAIRNMLPAKQP